jgi:hypothetical protein
VARVAGAAIRVVAKRERHRRGMAIAAMAVVRPERGLWRWDRNGGGQRGGGGGQDDKAG